MKLSKALMGAAFLACCLSPAGYGNPGAAVKLELDVLEMQSVPDGHYLINMETFDRKGAVNIEVKGNVAKCVNTSNAALKGWEGKFELFGNGVFQIVFHNPQHTASQWWFFRKDGSAVVREVPDRGEKQTAIPVADASLEPPKAAH